MIPMRVSLLRVSASGKREALGWVKQRQPIRERFGAVMYTLVAIWRPCCALNPAKGA